MNKALILSVLSVLALSACSTATTPLTLRNTASSLPKGKTQVDVGYSPEQTLSAAIGINSNWDIGVDLESISSGWTRYTFIERENGTAFAAIGGMFSGDIDTDIPFQISENGDNVLTPEGGGTIDGVYVGVLASIKPENTSLGLTGELRYINSRYNDFVLNGSGGGGIFNDGSAIYFNRGGEPFIVDSDDLEHIVQASFIMKFDVRTHLQINTGAVCHFNISENNPNIPDNECGFVLGASFLRR